MKRSIGVAAVALFLVTLAAAQDGLKETSVKMSGKVVTVRYSALAAGGQISATPAFLQTDSDLEVQGLAVPRGKYALYVLPDAGEWQLVVSRQTGPAGPLNPKMELGRVPMDMKKAAVAAGHVRMSLTSFGNVAGKLELALGNTLASVPFNLDTLKPNAEW